MVKERECLKCGFQKEKYSVPESTTPFIYNSGLAEFNFQALLSDNIKTVLTKYMENRWEPKEPNLNKSNLNVLVLVNHHQFDYVELAHELIRGLSKEKE